MGQTDAGAQGAVEHERMIGAVRQIDRQRVALETTGENLYGAIKSGIQKSKRAVRRSLRKSRHINRVSIRDFMEQKQAAA